MGYYVIKFVSEASTLQEETICDEKISTAGGLVVKVQYINFIQDNTILYWKQSPQPNNIIVSTQTILHPCLDVMTVTEVRNTKKCLQ